MHVLAGEVLALAHARTEKFEAAGLVDVSRRDDGSELIGLRDAVVARIEVRREECGEGEVRDGGVEDRNVVLIAVGRIGVVDPGLERLIGALPKEARIALEPKAGIEGQRRREAARRLVPVVAVAAHVVELVPGAHEFSLRNHEPARSAEGIAHALARNEAGAADARRMRKLRRVDHGCKFKSAPVGGIAVEDHLRDALVGNDRRHALDFESLVLRHAQRRIPVGIGPGETVVLRENRFRGFADASREVRDVVVVRDPVVVRTEGELLAVVRRLNAGAPSRVVVDAVVGEVVEVDLGFEVVVLEASFIAEHHAALRHDAGREGVVVVGGDVEVVGNCNVDAARGAHAVGGREKARAPLRADGERKPG